MSLLVIFGIHEVVVVTVIVEVLHLDFIDGDFFDRVGGTEAVLEHGTSA